MIQQMSNQDLQARRLQVTISESVHDYLQLKSTLTGKPIATLIGELTFESMRRELADLIELKKLTKETNTDG